MSDELRFKIIVGMLNEFPELREKVKNWLLGNGNSKSNKKPPQRNNVSTWKKIMTSSPETENDQRSLLTTGRFHSRVSKELMKASALTG
ncbi:MAG: hypothetical protein ACE5NN_00665 [Candidatus Bathyarchaeia archaeon]